MLIGSNFNNCPKIFKTLYTYLKSKNFVHVKLLLLNCRFLEVVWFHSLISLTNENYIGDELLDILTKFSPNSLIDVTIKGNCKYSNGAFEQFFESCRTRTKLNFWIFHNDYITKHHRIIVRKYISEGVINRSNLK